MARTRTADTEAASARRPLDGVRVLDLATFVAAPFSATILGEFGAEVIKVEQPGGGDPLRGLGKPSGRDEDSYFWLSEARNKRSVTLDLRAPEGADLLKRLAARSDVVCENFRPGTLEKWGLGWDVLSECNPGLVLLRISGFGQTGPYKNRPGFARIAHAFGGLAHLTGMPGGPPLTPGSTSLGDYIAGLYGAIGVLLALRARDATGRGQVVDMALYEAVFRLLDEIAPAHAADGTVRGRLGLGTSNACPHGHFETADGQWVAIACTSDKMFARLCEVMARPELAAPEKWARGARRISENEAVDAEVAAWTGVRSRADVLAECEAGEVPCAPVNTIADIFADPQFKARGDLADVQDPDLGEVTVPRVYPLLSDTPGRIDALGPRLGGDTDAVLGELLGLGDDDLRSLRDKGVI
jgi:crotonobetainyl-CoA:carnitine CoA-transferase CaiB-like acyl-CoA transferase